MKVCIFGAGAIGGLLGARFALAGEDVTVIDSDQRHLAAIKENGIKLLGHDSSVQTAKVRAVDSASAAGEQHLVVLGVKAQHLAQIAGDLCPLLGPETVLLTVQNGIPWWYFQKHGGSFDGKRLESLDPSGILSGRIDADRLIACVVYPAAATIAPGVIKHVEGECVPVGELSGRRTARLRDVCDLLVKAGLKSRMLTDVRAELWLKALGTLSFNPVSALTHATMMEICQFSDTRQLVVAMMEEAQTIANKLGITFRHTIQERVEGADAVGAHKTSMLQDVEAGRSLEVEALMGAILEMGKLTNSSAPAMQTVHALTRLLDNIIQTKGGALNFEITPKTRPSWQQNDVLHDASA
jgi:ketopantoate reductase